jgi:hypothetical protein
VKTEEGADGLAFNQEAWRGELPYILKLNISLSLSSIFFQRNKHLLEELPELEVHFLLFMD